jgi:hypothetical protein
MRTSEYVEICISIDDQIIGKRVFMWNGKKGKESKEAERQRERERVCALIETNNSVNQHPQQHRGEKHICGNKWMSAFVIN